MKSAISSNTAFWLVSGLSTLASATKPLATLTPCPSCPESIAPAPITITSQYQPVSTCTPSKTSSLASSSLSYFEEPDCTTYDWVSTVIPCMGGASSTTITKTDQIVELSHVSTVLTSLVPWPTKAPTWDGKVPKYYNHTGSSTLLTTYVVDISCPYNEMGPLALPPYAGSGLCKTCAEDKDGSKHQAVNVHKCLDGKCSDYAETWVSVKPTPSSSSSTATFSSSTHCPSGGVYTIPVTTTCTPEGPGYTPVTSTFAVTTSVASACDIEITKTIYVTFTGGVAAAPSSTTSKAAVSTATECPTNGKYTIPITKTFSHSAYTTPVTTTVFYTTSVIGAPKTIDCLTTITVTFIETCPVQTVRSGTTLSPTYTATTSPASVSASSTATRSSLVDGTVTTTSSSSFVTPTGPTSTSGSSTVETATSGSSTFETATGSSTFETATGSSTFETATSGSSTLDTTTSETTIGSTGSPTGPSKTDTPTKSHGDHTHTPHPTSPPSGPGGSGDCDFIGCFSSPGGFPSFQHHISSSHLTPSLCFAECISSGFIYSGLYQGNCFCASALESVEEKDKHSDDKCDISCPGDHEKTCGGDSHSGPKLLRGRGYEEKRLFDVYECPLPTSTTKTDTSSTTSGTPDASSDPDAEEEKRSINADMVLEEAKKKREAVEKVRRGGLLKGRNAKEGKANVVVKRDFGIKKPFSI